VYSPSKVVTVASGRPPTPTIDNLIAHFSFDTLLLGKKQRVTQDTLIIKNKGNHYSDLLSFNKIKNNKSIKIMTF